MENPTKLYIDTDKDYYVQGEKVDITGRLDIYLPGADMRFIIVDDHNQQIWDSGTIKEPYDHGNYELVNPPIDIFTSKPPYYLVAGYSAGLIGKKKFAYY